MPDQPKAKTPRYHHGHLKEALLEQALLLVTERGVKGWSLREVAKLLGVSTAAPYKHFADKNELLATLAENGFRLLMAMEEQADPSPDSGWEGVVARSMAYFDFGMEHPGYLDVMFDSLQMGPNPGLLQAAEASFRSLWEKIALAQGLPLQEALETTQGWWALTHGLSYLGNRQVLAAVASDVPAREIALSRLKAFAKAAVFLR